MLIGLLAWIIFEKKYEGKIYPRVSIENIDFSGRHPLEVETYWKNRNKPFLEKSFEFSFENEIATISAKDLGLGYDATLSATQAFLVGRSPFLLSNLYTKFFKTTNLSPYFRWKTNILDNHLQDLNERVSISVQNALFNFNNGKVTAFKPSRRGRRLNYEQTLQAFELSLKQIPKSTESLIKIAIVVEIIEPSISTDTVNAFGIRELVGKGYSEFKGSIPGRIHNVALAAAKLNGLLIKPGETFSFNKALGDISASTGFQQAYIIQEGRTVLGDGGGVCQVSTTLFRAALNAGLPIIERHAHAYRVGYYEQAGVKPGIDATVYSPSVDLQFKNNTPAYILIQTKIDIKNLNLAFEFYGASDNRKAEIFDHQVWGITPPLPTLYQDDLTLPLGTVKQVDFAAPGTNSSFNYKVTRNGETLEDTKFVSNFRPWRAIYLKGIAQ